MTSLSDEVRALLLADAVDYSDGIFIPPGLWTSSVADDPRHSSAERGREPFQDARCLVHHAWVRFADSGSLLELLAFVDSTKRVAVVDGPIGVGKTKLLYDLTAANISFAI